MVDNNLKTIFYSIIKKQLIPTKELIPHNTIVHKTIPV